MSEAIFRVIGPTYTTEPVPNSIYPIYARMEYEGTARRAPVCDEVRTLSEFAQAMQKDGAVIVRSRSDKGAEVLINAAHIERVEVITL